MRALLKVAVTGGLLLSAGCATVLTGTNDKISVSVPECGQASCRAFNNAGEWAVDPDAGTVVVRKDESALMVVCEVPGREPVAVSVPAGVEGWTWGNIMIGGLIGVLVDFGTGGLHSYRDQVEVPMSCDQPSGTAPTSG